MAAALVVSISCLFFASHPPCACLPAPVTARMPVSGSIPDQIQTSRCSCRFCVGRFLLARFLRCRMPTTGSFFRCITGSVRSTLLAFFVWLLRWRYSPPGPSSPGNRYTVRGRFSYLLAPFFASQIVLPKQACSYPCNSRAFSYPCSAIHKKHPKPAAPAGLVCR